MNTVDLKRKVLRNVRLSFGKTITAFFVLSALNMLIVSCLLFPFIGAGVQSGIVLFPILIVCSAAVFILQFGYFMIILKLYRGERAVLGHLFFGFRDWKRLSVLGAGLFAVYFVLLSGIVVFLFVLTSVSGGSASSVWILANGAPNEISVPASGSAAAVVLCAGLFSAMCAVLFRFAFVFPLLIDHPEIPVVKLLKQSAVMLRRKKMRLFLFCLRCGGAPLAVCVLSLCAVFAILFLQAPSAVQQSAGFLYTVSYVLSVVRILTALCAWYCAETDTQSCGEICGNTVHCLPESESAENAAPFDADSAADSGGNIGSPLENNAAD
ncbi:MAG: hypothetical protein NC041_10360 [Bacteroides sp.]|nr:hypothetical protein [Prevotella sp.]MCM1408883.1 hypothetical protein [Treponema brennaborense]MCM1470856.1 hypothetical protein [Bacteroides sp.]